MSTQKAKTTMSKIKMYYDRKGKTLSVWFDDPKNEAISEEIGGGTIVSKDKKGKIIGFEKLYVNLPKSTTSDSAPIEFAVN